MTVKYLTECFLTGFNFVLNQGTGAINTKLKPDINATTLIRLNKLWPQIHLVCDISHKIDV